MASIQPPAQARSFNGKTFYMVSFTRIGSKRKVALIKKYLIECGYQVRVVPKQYVGESAPGHLLYSAPMLTSAARAGVLQRM